MVHEDVAFDGAPGSTRGIEEMIAGLGRMFAITEHVEVVHRWVDGPDVLTPAGHPAPSARTRGRHGPGWMPRTRPGT